MTSNQSRRRSLLIVGLLAVLALLLAACGGDDDDAETTGSEVAATTTTGGDGGAGDGSEGNAGGGGEGGSGQTSGSGGGSGGSGSSSSGGDRSIQTFGEPADSATEKEMAAAASSYFAALADNDPDKACKYVAGAITEQLEQLVEQAREQGQTEIPEDAGSCESFLATAAKAYSGSAGPDVDRLSFKRFRVEDNRGFAIYEVPKRPRSFVPMALEDGSWKVAAIDGSPLP